MTILRPLLASLLGLALAACTGADASPPDTAALAGAGAVNSASSAASTEAAATGDPASAPADPDTPTDPAMTASNESSTPAEPQIATFGAGCFWCIEAVLEQVDGVLDVQSGYMGGAVENPTYEQVCSGNTGHAEVIQARFDPEKISYEQLLEWFWKAHDPTQLNRQGNDVGTQYRSAIFVHSPEQRRLAEASKAAEDASGRHSGPIVTEITDASTFYPAEEYHQDYYRLNPGQGYCRFIIAPKLDKLGLEK